MGIKVTINTQKTAYEGRYKVRYKRERRDIAELLKELQQGKKLRSIFGSRPVASAVLKTLSEANYIDKSEMVTSTGESFVSYPFFDENENGIYSLTVNELKDGFFNRAIATRLERKLSEVQANLSAAAIPPFYEDNEFCFDASRGEIGVMDSVSLIGNKAYVVSKDEEKIVFDLDAQTYKTDDFELKMGSNLFESLKNYAVDEVNGQASHFSLRKYDLRAEVNRIEDFKDSEIIEGKLSQFKAGNVALSNVPLYIKDYESACKYAYLYLYDLLMHDNYYSLSEMNEILQNEIVPKEIFSDEIRNILSETSIYKEGFKKNLSPDKYASLEYKLRIMDEYLGIESIVEDASFSRVSDYPGLVDYLTQKVSPSDVRKVYLVMGYALVKRGDNRIVECLEAMKERYSSIVIVSKKGKTAVEEDPAIREKVAALGVPVIEKTGLSSYYHDRYIIFEKAGGSYSAMLCTAEIGQILKRGETKGTILPIANSDTVKAGRSLLQMIKG